MSNLIFKLNNPLIISSSTGVTTRANGDLFVSKEFDGLQDNLINVSIGQAVETGSSVTFDSVTLDPNTMTIGNESKNIVLKDGSISGSLNGLQVKNNLTISGDTTTIGTTTFNGSLSAGSTSFTSTQTTSSVNTGSRKFGTETENHLQSFTGSMDITGSIDINSDVRFFQISNDTTTSGSSVQALITEKVAFEKLQSLKPDRDYLRKSFVHTGSFQNSSRISFNAITASAPTNLSNTTEEDFIFFINGMLIENDALEIQQVSSTDLRLNLNTTELGYSIDSNDEVIGFGKFNS